jgi:DeoR/GlpR family transcriptional regulator of sugar metabolism
MGNKKVGIKSALLKLFDEGKSEVEALEEVSKTHSSRNVSEKTVSKWYEKFRKENKDLVESKENKTKKFTDEFLIDLVNSNPDLSMSKLAKLAGTSTKTINNRLKELENDNEIAIYSNKDNLKLTDEFLIDLVNKNPTLTMIELAKLAGVSGPTIRNRINHINSKGVGVNYVKKKYRPRRFGESKPHVTYEFLDDLINSNPTLNMTELADLAGVSATTIMRKINKFNNSGKTLNYCKKSLMVLADDSFIDLVNKNPELSMEELSKCANTSIMTISRKVKQLSAKGEEEIYSSKEKANLTNERLIELVNENPDLSIVKLSKLAGVSPSTIGRRIKEINKNGVVVNYISKSRSKKESFTS